MIKPNLDSHHKSRNKLDPYESYHYVNSTLKPIPVILIENNSMLTKGNVVDAINSPINQSRLDESTDDLNLHEWKKASVADKIKRSFIKLSKNGDSILGDATKENNININNNSSSA